MSHACPSCGTAVDDTHNFCPSCGQPQGGVVTRSSPPAEDAELRPLTVMFCDLVGSTALAELFHPEELRALIQRYYAICDDAIRKHGGHVVKHIGDGVMAYFGYPVASDDDAAGAALAGLEICRGTAEVFHIAERTAGVDVRIGVNTGSAIVGLAGSGATREALSVGDTVNIAARVEAEAPTGRVAITETTRRLIDDRFELTALGPTELKGVSEPIELFLVDAELAPVHRKLARPVMVGRIDELARIRTMAEGVPGASPRWLVISGEPGVGKSRFVDATRDELGYRTVTVTCSRADQHSSLRPIAHLLAELAEPEAGGGPAWPDDEAASLLTPQARRMRQFESARGIIAGAARTEPLLMVVENLHWSDPSTIELLDWMATSQTDIKLFVVMTTRPVRDLPASFERMELGPLGPDDAYALIVAHDDVEPRVARAIIERADGVPLFLEELVRTAAEGSALDDEVPITLHSLFTAQLDRVGPARRIAQLGALLGTQFEVDDLRELADDPATVDDGIRALVDADLFTLVDDATVMFRHALMQDAVANSMVSSVRRREHARCARVYERRTDPSRPVAPQAIGYHWTRAGHDDLAHPYYMRAAAAAALDYANEEALGLYEQALQGLDRLIEDDPERFTSELCEVQERRGDILALLHDLDDAEEAYRLALASTFDPVRQARLFTKVALVHQQNQPLAMAAFAEAARALEAADPDRDDVRATALDLELAQLRMLYWFGDAAAMRTIIERVEPSIERYASPAQKVEFYDQCVLANFRSERYAMSDETRELGARYVAVARESGDKGLLTEAQFTYAFILLFGGQPDAALDQLEQALELAQEIGNRAIEVRATIYHSTAHRLVGVADRSFLERCHDSLELARIEQMPEYEAVALTNLAWLAWHTGDAELAADLVDDAIELWESTGMAWPFRWLALFPRLAVAVAHGDAHAVARVVDALVHDTQQQLPDGLAGFVEDVAGRVDGPDTDLLAAAGRLTTAARDAGLFEEPTTDVAVVDEVRARRRAKSDRIR